MTDTPPDWVLIEAAKRSEWTPITTAEMRKRYCAYNPTFRTLCDMIQKYEQPPVDRKLLCAREAGADVYRLEGANEVAADVAAGVSDNGVVRHAIRAIELWESGYGCD